MRLFGFLSATRIPAQATSRSQPQPQKTLLPALATHTPIPKPFISVRFTIRSRTRTPQSLPFPNSSSTQHILKKLHIAASSSSDMPHVPFVRSSLLPQHTCTKPDSSTRRDSRLQNRSARSPHKSPSFPLPELPAAPRRQKNTRAPDPHPCQHALQGTGQTSRSPRDPRHRLARPCKK